MIRHNFCRSDGRLVKLFLFSTLLHKSPRTSMYFATFEKKREVMSPLPTQPNFLVFGKYIYIYIDTGAGCNVANSAQYFGNRARISLESIKHYVFITLQVYRLFQVSLHHY